MFKRAQRSDAALINEVLEYAKEVLLKSGIDQWQNGYPNLQVVKDDIDRGDSYILETDGTIKAVCAVSFEGEPTYEDIYDGEWLNDTPYAVIHRIATAESAAGQGAAVKIMREAENLCREQGVYSIRIDTHEDNRAMQGLLGKLEYKWCGRICFADGAPRLAFQKNLQ